MKARVVTLVAALLAVVALSCSAAPGPSASSNRAQIEAVLAAYRSALQVGDRAAASTLVDPERPALRRWHQDRFDLYQREGLKSPLTLGRLEAYTAAYQRGYVERRYGYEAWYFRREAQAWLITQPRDDELGEERSKQVPDVELRYRAVDDTVAESVLRGYARARDVVAASLPATIHMPALVVQLHPTAASAGPAVSGTQLWSSNRTPIRLFTVLLTADGSAASDQMVKNFTESAASRVLFEVDPAGRADWWIFWGWVRLVASNIDAAVIKTVCAGIAPPSLQRMTGGATFSAGPSSIDTLWHFAGTMADYVISAYGRDTFWALFLSYQDAVDQRANFAKALKIAPEQFYADWLNWLKKKYC